jgi:hypothetical protein
LTSAVYRRSPGLPFGFDIAHWPEAKCRPGGWPGQANSNRDLHTGSLLLSGWPFYSDADAPPKPILLGWGSSVMFTRNGIPVRSRFRPVHSDSISMRVRHPAFTCNPLRNLFVLLYGTVLTDAGVKGMNLPQQKEGYFMLTRTTRFCLLVLLALLASFTTAAAQAGTVALGSDYFQTLPGVGDTSGTWFNFGNGIGVVDFQGVPRGGSFGNTDTIVQRQADATINGAAIPIQLVALHLGSEAPVLVMGNLYNVSLILDSTQLAKDVGTIQIMGNTTTGGTFISSLNVFFDAQFKPVGAGSPFDIKSETTLINNGAVWSPTPENGTLLVKGPLGSQQADCHTNPDCLVPGSSEVDFFLQGSLMECNGSNGCHVVKPVPEPSALLLLVPALIGVFWKLRSTLV